jgi:transcription elongation factor Elf1
MEVFVGLLFMGFVIFCLYRANNTPEAIARREADAKKQAQIVCPHCQAKGGVTRTTVKKKQGISGGKATGALLTGGVSMLATGLSRKANFTRMSCSNCGTSWDVA